MCSLASKDQKYLALGTLWNKSVDTVGDRIRLAPVPENDRNLAHHADTRTLDSVLREACCENKYRACQHHGASSRADCQALVWRCMSDCQAKGLETKVAECMRGWHRWLIVCRRFDEASVYMHFPEAIAAQYIEWELQKLHAERYLADDDKSRIAALLAHARDGTAHVLSQRASVRTSGWYSPIVVRLVVVQRTSASNSRQALDVTIPCFSTKRLQSKVAPFVAFLLLIFGTDEASGNERYFKELVLDHQPARNILTLFLLLLRP